MAKLSLVFAITPKANESEFAAFFEKYGAAFGFAASGKGTARQGIMNRLGLSDDAREVFFGLFDREKRDLAFVGFERELGILMPGRGVAFSVPLSSLGRSLADMLKAQDLPAAEEEETVGELIIVIVNNGYTEPVMSAARAAGAAGGTILHAKGTHDPEAAKFLGISLASEKEIVLIAVPKQLRNSVMHEIIQNAGPSTDAGAVLLSLPIEKTAGFNLAVEA